MLTRLQSKKRKVNYECTKEDLIDTIDQVYTGEFFDIPELKIIGRQEDVTRVHNSLEDIRKHIIDSIPSVIDIIEGEFTLSEKQIMLEHIHVLSNSDIGSFEYEKSYNFLKRVKNPQISNILNLNTTENNKQIIQRMNMSCSTNSDTESEKYKTWLDRIASVPFGVYVEPEINIDNTRRILDEDLAFLDGAKDRIINLLAKLKRNPNVTMQSILLHGSIGTGKTSISKSIAKALGRPFSILPLAGESDASMLTGHHFTYSGAICGRIISILSETKCMNPVILIDELDKISKTEHGRELLGALIHLTDTTSNNKYSHDRYFAGMEFDLSKILFIFTANDMENINHVLLDRLFSIKVDDYNKQQQHHICRNYIIPRIYSDFGLQIDELPIDDSVISKILQVVNNKGLREVYRIVELIVSRINTLVNCSHNISMKYKSLASYYTVFRRVCPDHIDILLDDYIQKPVVLSMYM
jgi:ATP-dependent Lon protease